MNSELTNLLPANRRRAIKRDYFIRIGVVASVLVTTLTLAAAILLIPTYVFLNGNADAKKARLAHIASSLSTAEEKALSAHLTALSANMVALSTLSSATSVSGVIRAMLAISRPGVTLSGFSYAPSEDKSSVLTVSGIATTRDALRSYQLALQNAAFARSVVLPVSAYAKDSDITFTITIILSP